MCGICGEVFKDPGRAGDQALLGRMAAVMRSRGPDGEGVRVGPGFGLAASRLAVVDPSPLALQPLVNEDGSLLLVFNGEIYNHEELRDGLEERGHAFRSACDAEVVLHLFEEEGEACLARLNGMFALAVFDVKERALFAARDRLGQKPFFYRRAADGSLLFASEIKALLAHPAVAAAPDRDAIGEYLVLGYVPGEGTAFKGIRRLPPAHYLRWKNGRLSLRRWWRLDRSHAFEVAEFGGEEGLTRELLCRIEAAVGRRLGGDAAMGVLLSGGVDSSCVAALSGIKRTYSIGFHEREYDELPQAERTAALLQARHSFERLGPDAIEVLPDIVRHLEEPFADSSALPTYFAARLASRDVKVVLSGDGGDESFAGYERYAAHCIAQKATFLPRGVRRGATRIAAAALGVRSGGGRSFASGMRRFLAAAAEGPVERYFNWMALFSQQELARLLEAPPPEGALIGGLPISAEPARARFRGAWEASSARDGLGRLMDVDLATYLPGDLLVKMDRMSMAWSVEARSPFLDHELMEFAARIPSNLKLDGLFGTKHILKRALRDVLPPAVLSRRKKGFGAPIDAWLRGPLRDFSHDILLGKTAKERGLIRQNAVAVMLYDHSTRHTDAHHRIWSLLMLELWFREFIDNGGMA